MDKPQMKSEIAIINFHEGLHRVYFCATPDAASEMAQFGQIYREGKSDNHMLYIDARYDLLEVVRYIREYGQVTK